MRGLERKLSDDDDEDDAKQTPISDASGRDERHASRPTGIDSEDGKRQR